MRPVLVASRTFGYGTDRENLRELFRAHRLSPEFLALAEALPRLGTYEGIILGTDRFPREFFEKAKKLKVLCKYGAGTDNIDFEAGQEHGVTVLSLPALNAEAVAEMALGLMFAVARRITEADRKLRGGQWAQLMGRSLVGKKLGLIGTGAIGLSLARLAAGLGMELLGYDLKQDSRLAEAGGRYTDLKTLLGRADFISLHLPATSQTRHLLGEAEFRLMKPEAFVINTARGAIIDEKALLAALREKRIAGAGLDVFEIEPPFGSELLELDNVVCTSHISAYTDETLRRMDQEAVAVVSRALEGVS